MNKQDAQFRLETAKTPRGDVLVMEYGVRPDRECLPAINEQIIMARRLYNNLVACIADVVGQMQAYVLERAPESARAVATRLEALEEEFQAAKAAKDEDAMKRVAQERRSLRPQLYGALKETRTALKKELSQNFLSRIGNNSSCDTYRLRSEAVKAGLGWATANAVLDSALQAFKASFTRGRAPRFAKGADKTVDTLTLQFTAPGGLPASVLLGAQHNELHLIPSNGCGRRKYGDFQWRLGAAKANAFATGTWQYHRQIPEGSHVGMARLVRKRVGKDLKWSIQLMVKLPEPVSTGRSGSRSSLAAVHFGWAHDVSGRRVAAVASCADPERARLIQLPVEIEEALDRSAVLASGRDSRRDEIVPQLKSWTPPATLSPELSAELVAIKRLPAQHIAQRRLHFLCSGLRAYVALPDWLEGWRKADKLDHQSQAHLAARARNRRRTFYRELASSLAQTNYAVVIEPLDLAKAAVKVDEATGERSDFARKARSGRVVAALYELESAIRWACTKAGTALIEISGPTVTRCSHCGEDASAPSEEDHQELACSSCGAVADRKLSGAAVAWQIANEQREDLVECFWLETRKAREEERTKALVRKARMAEGRRVARTSSEQTSP